MQKKSKEHRTPISSHNKRINQKTPKTIKKTLLERYFFPILFPLSPKDVWELLEVEKLKRKRKQYSFVIPSVTI